LTSLRLIPPIAVPQGVAEVFAALAGGDGTRVFGGRLLSLASRKRVGWYGSGRAALCDGLRRLGENGTIVLPAYTCWSVAAAAVRAGWRVRPVDVDPETLDFDPEELRLALAEQPQAVLSVHLFSQSADLTAHAEAFRDVSYRPYWIEDAAQALPQGRSGADAVLLSFGRGKPLPLGGGGAWLDDKERSLGHAVSSGGGAGALSFAATACLGRPAIYRLPAALPFLKLGTTTFDPSFDEDAVLHRWQTRLALRIRDRGEFWKNRRNEHAEMLINGLNDLPGFRRPGPANLCGPLRLPILAPARTKRDAWLEALPRLGVAASAMYPGTLADIPALTGSRSGPSRFPGAETLRDRLITLPVYSTLGSRGCARVIDAVRRVWEGGA
jgi:dTDP-4-amino-4,6-dideoxygalactose transaminase